MLHLHSGDVAAEMLSGRVPGRHLVYADVLFEGPVPREWTPEWGRVRAEALCREGLVPFSREAVAGRLDGQARAIAEAAAEAERVYLWFDDCLYDQLLLQFVVACLLPERPGQTVWLVPCPAGVAGFGEMAAKACAAQWSRAVPLDEASRRRSRETLWPALTSDCPEGIQRLAREGDASYPALGEACGRLLEQLPQSHHGLTLLESRVLSAVLDGVCEFQPLFRRVSAAERHPFFGDEYLRLTLRRLAEGASPLVRVRGEMVTATLQGMRTQWGWGHWRELNPVRRLLANLELTGEPGEWSWEPWRRECVRRRAR